MSNAIFPTFPGLSWPITKTPQWSTGVQRSENGREIRRKKQSRPTWKFSVSFEVLRNYQAYVEYQQLVAFFNARSGAFDSFLLLDDSDKTAALQGIGTGDGVNKKFTLLHTIQGWTEPVGFGSPSSVTVNGVTTGAYTTDGATITFTTAPSAGTTIAWSGTFYYRVRFAADLLDFEQFMKDYWTLKKCEMVGVFDA